MTNKGYRAYLNYRTFVTLPHRGLQVREYTRYAVQELVQPLEYEKLISELLFNLSQDPAFPYNYYPDIRSIGGNKDYGHDAISITWDVEDKFTKTVFAFSKRKDWQKKLGEDLKKRATDKNIRLFIYVTTEKVGSWKLPEKLSKLEKGLGFAIEIIDIEDIVIWLDNTSWGKSLKRKYGIDADEVFIYIKPYDITLKSDEKNEEFFRIMGPIEIDFFKGIILKRKEVESVISKLRDNRVHIIIGPPASGKTVLARNIGYELHTLCNVYWLEMQDLIDDQTRVYLEIQRLNRTNSLLIIENGHKSPEKLERLIRYFINNTKIVKMLITSRDENNRIECSEELSQLIGDRDYKTYIYASDIAAEIIQFYSGIFGKNIEKDLDKILAYRDDLWLLSYLFKAYKDKGGIDNNIIFEKVRDDLIGYDEGIGIGASDIILIISWITQNSAILPEESNIESNYLPIDDFLLIDKLGYDPSILFSLTKFGIIKRVNNGYWCWHTSLSGIYIKCAEKYPTLLRRINSKLRGVLGDFFDSDSNLKRNINIFNIYLNIHPEFAYRILEITSTSGILLFKWPYILNNLNTRDLIYTNLRKDDLEHINSVVHLINIFSNVKDKEEIYREFIDELGPDKVEDKLMKCENSKHIVYYAYLFYRMDKTIGKSIIDTFKDNITKNFDKLELSDMGDIIESLFEINPSFAEKLIDIDHLVENKLRTSSLSDIVKFIGDINLIRRYYDKDGNWLEVCLGFLERNMFSITAIIAKDKDSELIRTILRCISVISRIDNHKGKEIVCLIGEQYVISRLREINDLTELGYAISDIEDIYPEFKNSVLIEFIKFIEAEIKLKGIFSVTYFFSSLFKDSRYLENGKATITQMLKLMNRDIIMTMKASSLYPYCELKELGI